MNKKVVYWLNILFLLVVVILSINDHFIEEILGVMSAFNSAFNIFIYPGLFYYYAYIEK